MKTLKRILQHAKNIGYKLPGNPATDLYSFGCSGGGDSTCMAILLHYLFPGQEFLMVFTDTKAESGSVYRGLCELEDFLDTQIIRLGHERGLYGLIEDQGGFMPGLQKARYCTRMLKIVPYMNWVKSIVGEGQVLHTFSGIRADEKARHGLANSEQVKSHFPLADLGVTREDVFAILNETVGIPTLYSRRTRSGCSICPGMRTSEFCGVLLWDESAYDKAMRVEKLTGDDVSRFYTFAVSLSKEIRVASNQLPLPIPERVDLRTADTALPVKFRKTRRKRKNPSDDSQFDGMESNKPVLWLGAEFFVHPLMGMFAPGSPGVWWQEAVSVSTSKAGIIMQMKNHYKHRLDTAAVKHMTADQMREQLHLAIYQVELPEGSVELDGPCDKSYTWKKGIALSQLKQHFSWLLRSLQIAAIDQQIAEYEGYPELTWENEQWESLSESRKKITAPYGKVLAMDLLEVKEEKKPEVRSDNQLAFDLSAA